MSKPIIAVTSDYRHMEPYMWHCVPAPYVNAATDVADVLPLAVPVTGSRLDIDSLLGRVDGLLVTGSRTNVHPSNYGEEETKDHEPFDPDRDATTLPLIRAAIKQGVPVLAICRGIQELNVAMGGTLTAEFQKKRNIDDHGYPWEGTPDERFALAHGLKIKQGSCIAEILKDEIEDDSVEVNSLHTQALNELGNNVVVEATSHDGTIEAITVKGAPGFVVGVQWHPEYWAATDSPSATIFKAFGTAAREYLAKKNGLLEAAE
ncbi:MAG: gamma-glutamyl-gamma-aminobutyrate hydrolase family protein [Rhizobiaceae bacterium]